MFGDDQAHHLGIPFLGLVSMQEAYNVRVLFDSAAMSGAVDMNSSFCADILRLR